MGHLDYVISVEKQQGLDTAEFYGELTKCFKYFTELLHDLNVIINNDGKGETYGLTHQLDGSKVDELENFFIQRPVRSKSKIDLSGGYF